MYLSRGPVGNKVIIQLNGECSTWEGKLSWKQIDVEGMTSPAHLQLLSQKLTFLIIQHTINIKSHLYVRGQVYRTEVYAPHPLISQCVKGICQEWTAVLSPLPSGLSTRGPGVSAQA